MSPKNPRLRSVPTQTTEQTAHAQAAGSDGDLRPDRAAEPSTADIESNARELGPDLSPKPLEAEEREQRWVYHVDELHFTIERVKALSHALFAVVFTEQEFWQAADMPIAETLPLSEMAKELSDKAGAHVEALESRFSGKSPIDFHNTPVPAPSLSSGKVVALR